MSDYQSAKDYMRDDQGSSRSLAGQVSDMAESAQDMGSAALDQIEDFVRPVGLSIKNHPMTTLAVVAGVAMAFGALWTLRRNQQRSHLEHLTGRMGDAWNQVSRGRQTWF